MPLARVVFCTAVWSWKNLHCPAFPLPKAFIATSRELRERKLPESVPHFRSTTQQCIMCLRVDGCGCFDSTMELPALGSRLRSRWPGNWHSPKASLRGNACWTGCRCSNHNSKVQLHASLSDTCLK